MLMFLDEEDEPPAPGFDAEPAVAEVTSTVTLPDAPEVPAAATDLERPVALVFASRTAGNPPHVVIRQPTVPVTLTCTCMAALGLDRRPKGCHAMVAARALMGLPPVP